MFPMRENIVGDDALAVCLRKLNQRHWTRRLFIQNRAQLGFSNNLLKNGELGAVEMIFLLFGIEMFQIKRPDADFESAAGSGVPALPLASDFFAIRRSVRLKIRGVNSTSRHLHFLRH